MSEQKQTEPEDFQARVDEFKKRYGAMRTELQVDLASLPVLVPNEKGTFEIGLHAQFVDLSNQPVESPFMQKSK